MAVNPDLNAMLDHTVKIGRGTETVVKGVTKITQNWTTVGSKSVHLQPVTPQEVQKVWGQAVEGTHQMFLNSTIAVARGDLVKQTTGPYPSGTKWWIEALRRYTTTGGQHTRALLKITTESTA